MFEHGVIVVGSTTIDKIMQGDETFFKLGGVTTYAGMTFHRHHIETTIVTNVAPHDVSLLHRFFQEQIRVCNGATEHTTHFIHYNDGDERRQELPLMATPIHYQQIVNGLNSASLLHLGPLYPTDIAADALQQLRRLELFVSLDLQGYVRQQRYQIVSPMVSADLPYALRLAKIVKAAVEELTLILENYHISVSQLMKTYDIQEMVITSGSKGGIIRTINGEEVQYAAESVTSPVDTTGAGDVFFASYLVHRFFHTKSVAESASQAAKVAAQHVEGRYITPQHLYLSAPSIRYAFEDLRPETIAMSRDAAVHSQFQALTPRACISPGLVVLGQNYF